MNFTLREGRAEKGGDRQLNSTKPARGSLSAILPICHQIKTFPSMGRWVSKIFYLLGCKFVTHFLNSSREVEKLLKSQAVYSFLLKQIVCLCRKYANMQWEIGFIGVQNIAKIFACSVAKAKPSPSAKSVPTSKKCSNVWNAFLVPTPLVRMMQTQTHIPPGLLVPIWKPPDLSGNLIRGYPLIRLSFSCFFLFVFFCPVWIFIHLICAKTETFL